MKFNTKFLVILLIAIVATSGFSKEPKVEKPEKLVKEAVNNTAKIDDIYMRITLGKDKRFVWDGYIKDNKEIMFYGSGSVPEANSTEKAEIKRVFFDGKKYYIEKRTDVWEEAKSSDFDNFGATHLRGTLLNSPFDLFNLIKKYSMDECEYITDEKIDSEKITIVQCKQDEKKSAKFVDYHTFWKELKKEEHWKDSKVSDSNVQTNFFIDKKSELLTSLRFEYKVEFICNYGKGDKRCMGCINEIGDVITYDFLTAKDVDIKLPDSLKRKLGLKDTAEATGGLKLTLLVSKNRINKGESLEFEVIWENVSKKEIKIARELKFNPYLLFSIDGELDSTSPRYDKESDEKSKDADDKPLVLKPGKTYKEIFFMENDGRLVDDQTIRVLALGSFYIKAKTKLQDTGEYVESNSVEITISP